MGELNDAVYWYTRAVDLGWRRLRADRDDGWLARLAGDPRFEAAQDRIARDLDAMRQQVLEMGVPRAPQFFGG